MVCMLFDKDCECDIELGDVVDDYFEFRKYKEPTAEQALLFLISEIGELTEAFLERYPQELNLRALVFNNIVSISKTADEVVSETQGWVRNNDRTKKTDISDEVGDALMMLTKFAGKLNIDPVDGMLDKMAKKGFRK